MIRQTPFSFCTPNGHTGVIFVIQYYHFNSYFEGHHFLRWGSLKYFSLSLCFLSRGGWVHTERGITQHSILTHSNRKEEMKSSGEAVKRNRSIMESHVEQSFSRFSHTVTSPQGWQIHIKIKVISGDNRAGGLRKRRSFRCKRVAPGLLTSGTWQPA